jgi:hypothetical protein
MYEVILLLIGMMLLKIFYLGGNLGMQSMEITWNDSNKMERHGGNCLYQYIRLLK